VTFTFRDRARQNDVVSEFPLHDDGKKLEEDPPWSAWTPDEIGGLLHGVDARWYVVAGWAVDIFRGEQTREHEDLEIGVFASDFAKVRDALGKYECEVVGSNKGEDAKRWPLGSPAFDEHFQTWIRDPISGVYLLDIFRDPHDGDTWKCRRDEAITLPYDQLVRMSSGGIPYMSPEIVLLFKAKHDREKDRDDFNGVRPLLTSLQTEWLRHNLGVIHPDHRWLALL
jgi:hypothetical protein